MFPATAPWMITSRAGIVITPNSDATSSAGSLPVELLAIADDHTDDSGTDSPCAHERHPLWSRHAPGRPQMKITQPKWELSGQASRPGRYPQRFVRGPRTVRPCALIGVEEDQPERLHVRGGARERPFQSELPADVLVGAGPAGHRRWFPGRPERPRRS